MIINHMDGPVPAGIFDLSDRHDGRSGTGSRHATEIEKVEIEQRIAVQQQESLRQCRARKPKRAGRAERGRLDQDAYPVVILELVGDLLTFKAGDDDDLQAVTMQLANKQGQERLSRDWEQRFGSCVRQRTEPGAQPPRQNDRLLDQHRLPASKRAP
jgi:hypothetical protein